MVAAAYIRHCFTAEVCRAGVVGVLEQHSLGPSTSDSAVNGAGQKPHHTVDQRHAGTSGEHKVTDGHLFIGQPTDAFIEAFVVTANTSWSCSVVVRCRSACCSGRPWGDISSTRALPPGNRLHSREHRFGLAHHAAPPP